ncbi:MAG: nitrate/nitrite transporter [Deferribacterales bacterium]
MSYIAKGSPLKGLTGATLGFFFGFAAVALFGPTAKKLQVIMGISPAQVGLLVAIPALSGSLLRIPFSAWVDKDGGRKPFMVLLLMALAGMVGLSALFLTRYPDNMTADLYPLILLFGFMSGCGIATFSVGISQVAYWFPQKKQGWALGTFGGLGNLAPGIFSFLLPLALSIMPLPAAYVVWSLILFTGVCVYWFTAFNAPYFQALSQGASKEEAKEFAVNLYSEASQKQELFPSGGVVYTLVKSASNPYTWILVLLYFVTFGGFIALTAWFPTFWQSLYGFSVTSAGFLTAFYAVLTSLFRVPGGSFADKIGGTAASLVSVAVLGAGSLLVVFTGNFPLTVLGIMLMAVGMGVNNAAVFKLVPKYIPEAIGGAAGWVGGLGAFGGFVLPPVLASYVSRNGDAGYRQGFIVYVLMAVLSVLLILFLKRSEKRGGR